MAFIKYVSPELIPESDRISDEDNILRIHAVHSRMLKLHYELYVELMHRPGPITRIQREMIGTMVSSINGCVY
jgi:hypothetical protein